MPYNVLFEIENSPTHHIYATEGLVIATYRNLSMGVPGAWLFEGIVLHLEEQARRCWPDLPLVWLGIEPYRNAYNDAMSAFENGDAPFKLHQDKALPEYCYMVYVESWEYNASSEQAMKTLLVGWFSPTQSALSHIPEALWNRQIILEQANPIAW